MAVGGRILADTLDVLRTSVRAGMTTADLDQIAERLVRSHAGAVAALGR